MEKNYYVLAFYHFCDIERPHSLVKQWLRYLKNIDAKGRIYISEEGVNAQMSLHTECFAAFEQWLRSDPRFADVDMKSQPHGEHAFPKVTVKYREQLAALDAPVDRTKCGSYVTPEQWRAILDEGDTNTVVVDVRNDYEWDVGHFAQAERPNCSTFREFPEFAEQLKERYDPKKTRVLMYCTGGIRCEIFSPLLKEKGFEQVYQLEGGVIKYGLDQGHSHWRGKLFVFDDRLVVPIAEGNNEVISRCSFCQELVDSYYNCANMDCNALFIACADCAAATGGCCSELCTEAPRVRPFAADPGCIKPYRKLTCEQKQQINAQAGL